MPVISPFYVALACGAAGAYVDVTPYVSFAPGDGVAGSWGKQDQFRDTNPGTWSLYFNNLDGRFTPDTTNGILATPLTEGMGVNWQLGTRFIAGSIIGFTIVNDATGRIRVDVDDMLGNLARNTISFTARSMVLASHPYLYWPFNEAVGSSVAVEQSGNQQPPLDPSAVGFPPPTFGVAGVSYLGETQATFPGGTATSGGGVPGASGTPTGGFTTINYTSGSMGCWGAEFTLNEAPNGTSGLLVYIRANGYATATSSSFRFGLDANAHPTVTMGTNSVVSALTVAVGAPHYLQMVLTNSGSASITAELFVDGVSQGTCLYGPTGADPAGLSSNFLRTPGYVLLQSSSGVAAPSTSVAHLSHTPLPVAEYLLGAGTESALLTAAVATTYGATLGALPTDLSTAVSGQLSGSSAALAKVNDVIRSEQGYLDCATTGTLLAPVQAIRVRARQRPATVSYSFDAVTELANRAEFIRDITNLVSTATAAGPSTATTWLDPSVTSRAASANTSDKVVLTQYVDQLGYAQDRVNRGKNSVLRAPSFVIDAMTTPTDRSADLLAIQFGDRIQITELDPTVTGSSTYDCWIIGRAEAQDIGQQKFTFYVQPVLPATAIYDTNLYMSGGLHTLNTTITSGATSLGVLSSDLLTYFEQVATPYTILIDSEQITVTACGAPSAGVQTMTVTRAANGTTAAAHTAGAAIEIATASLYPF